MNISIGNLNITNYCIENVSHIKFRHDLIEDDFIYEFVSTSIGNDLLEFCEKDSLELGCSYIIEDKGNPIGYIYLGSIGNETDVIELRYAVHSEYRRLGYLGYSDSNRKGYGQLILEECAKYLFKTVNIKAVELHIRKDNEASIRCAEKAKYKRVGSNEEEYYYTYRTFRGK